MLLAIVLLGALSGCGGGSGVPAACDDRPEEKPRAADQARADFASLRLSDLGEGWTSVRPDQPLHSLRPPLGGEVETARTSSPIFARGGIVARSSTTLFDSPPREIDFGLYAECLAGRFATGRVEAAQGRVELTVDRPTGEGTDVVTVFARVQGRTLLVIEFVHDGSIGALAQRVVERVSRRTAGG